MSKLQRWKQGQDILEQHIIERDKIPVCPHCETGLSLDHFLWICQGTKTERDQIAINIWQTGLAGLAKLIHKENKNLPRNLKNDKESAFSSDILLTDSKNVHVSYV
jgi:hypothetical protein